jgi:hypothetical protein
MPNDTNESFWKGTFSNKIMNLLLGVGLPLILWNVAVVFRLDTRPNAWLYPLNMVYWSDYFSVILWIVAIWLIAESIDITEDFRPLIRKLVITSALLVMIFVWRDSFGFYINFAIGGHSPWFYAVAIGAICCLIRCLLLLYGYLYGEDEIDLQEAQWFWAISGFFFVGLAVIGTMGIIPVKMQIHAGAEDVATSNLLKVCSDGLLELIRQGTGSFALRMFAFLLLVSSVAFVYLIGRWLLVIYLKIRGE